MKTIDNRGIGYAGRHHRHRHYDHSAHNDDFCVCPRCDEKTPHRRGVPCRQETCPHCGAKSLLREGSEHHQLYLEKQAKKQGGDNEEDSMRR